MTAPYATLWIRQAIDSREPRPEEKVEVTLRDEAVREAGRRLETRPADVQRLARRALEELAPRREMVALREAA